MPQILVTPLQLRRTAEQLRSHAQKMDNALQSIDKDILSLKGHHFLGNRADAVQAHYLPKREALAIAKEIVVHFAAELETAAKTFELADRTESRKSLSDGSDPALVPGATPAPMPKGLPANWKDIENVAVEEKGVTPELISAVLEYEKANRNAFDDIADLEAKFILWYEGKLEDTEIFLLNKMLALKGESLETISFGPAQMNPDAVIDLVNKGYIPKPDNWDTDQTDVILKMLLDEKKAPMLVSARLEQIYDYWQKGGVDISDRPDVLGNLYGFPPENPPNGVHVDLNENQGPRGEAIEKIVVRLKNVIKTI